MTSKPTSDTEAQQPPQAFILKTKAGQWAYEIHIDGELYCGGAGYESQFDAIEGAQEAGALFESMQLVLPMDS